MFPQEVWNQYSNLIKFPKKITMFGEKKKDEPQLPFSLFTIKEQPLYLCSLFREFYTVYGYFET